MGWVRLVACCVGVVACLVVAGCGGGSGTTGGSATSTGTGTEQRNRSSAEGAHGETEPAHSVQSQGIKGENPHTEAQTDAHISHSDCARLARLAAGRLGTTPARRSQPRPPLSRCRLTAPGVSINVYLDSGFAAKRRYRNRIEETVQFNAANPAATPHPVPHVGEKAPYDANANWIPALRSLLAVRGNRWLTVTISAAGRSNRELRREAATLARAGFRLTASRSQ